MSGLSTKDVKTGGGGLPKTIAPGEHVLKINNIELKRYSFMEEEKGYYLILNVETKPIEGFEGFFINKDDESLGRYEGQIGQIKTNKFYYKDGKTKKGIEILRDMEILKQLKNICLAADNVEWFDEVDSKFATIEEFIEGINKSKVFKSKFFRICVAAKEFERNNGFTGYDLFFPKLSRGKVAIEGEEIKTSKILKFDENNPDHWTKLSPTETKNFGDDADNTSLTDATDLAGGAPEFEL